MRIVALLIRSLALITMFACAALLVFAFVAEPLPAVGAGAPEPDEPGTSEPQSAAPTTALEASASTTTPTTALKRLTTTSMAPLTTIAPPSATEGNASGRPSGPAGPSRTTTTREPLFTVAPETVVPTSAAQATAAAETSTPAGAPEEQTPAPAQAVSRWGERLNVGYGELSFVATRSTIALGSGAGLLALVIAGVAMRSRKRTVEEVTLRQ